MVTIGKSSYTVRIGPSTLEEAVEFCLKEQQASGKSMALYSPSFETIHKMIYEKISAYGVTTFWTNARYNFNQRKMEWM